MYISLFFILLVLIFFISIIGYIIWHEEKLKKSSDVLIELIEDLAIWNRSDEDLEKLANKFFYMLENNVDHKTCTRIKKHMYEQKNIKYSKNPVSGLLVINEKEKEKFVGAFLNDLRQIKNGNYRHLI